MNVTCPECGTVYRVDPRKVPDGGIRARCARCPAEFLVAEPSNSDSVDVVGAPGTADLGADPDSAPVAAATEAPMETAAMSGDDDVDEADGSAADEAEYVVAADEPEGAVAADAYHTPVEAANDADFASEQADGAIDHAVANVVTDSGDAIGWESTEVASGESEFGGETAADIGVTGMSPLGVGSTNGGDESSVTDETDVTSDLPLLTNEPNVDGVGDGYGDPDGFSAITDQDAPFSDPSTDVDPAGGEAASIDSRSLENVELASPAPEQIPADSASEGVADLESDAALEGAETTEAGGEVPVVIPVGSESDIAAATGAGDGFDEVPRPAANDDDLPPPPFGSADPHDRARRLARALVSDIVVYHPDRRERSLRQGTVRQEFREEIRKSWDEYVGHVGNQIARDTSYFRDALNELLAGGTQVF